MWENRYISALQIRCRWVGSLLLPTLRTKPAVYSVVYLDRPLNLFISSTGLSVIIKRVKLNWHSHRIEIKKQLHQHCAYSAFVAPQWIGRVIASQGAIKTTLISMRKEIEIINLLYIQNEHHWDLQSGLRDICKMHFHRYMPSYLFVLGSAARKNFSRSYYPFRGALISATVRMAWTSLGRVSIHLHSCSRHIISHRHL